MRWGSESPLTELRPMSSPRSLVVAPDKHRGAERDGPDAGGRHQCHHRCRSHGRDRHAAVEQHGRIRQRHQPEPGGRHECSERLRGEPRRLERRWKWRRWRRWWWRRWRPGRCRVPPRPARSARHATTALDGSRLEQASGRHKQLVTRRPLRRGGTGAKAGPPTASPHRVISRRELAAPSPDAIDLILDWKFKPGPAWPPVCMRGAFGSWKDLVWCVR